MDDTLRDKDILEGLLEIHRARITFTKVDGTTRILTGTRNPALIELFGAMAPWRPPLSREELTEQHENPNPNTIKVFDLTKAAWRTFRLDSLLDFELIDVPDSA